jgi:glycosyl hydrolase family 26
MRSTTKGAWTRTVILAAVVAILTGGAASAELKGTVRSGDAQPGSGGGGIGGGTAKLLPGRPGAYFGAYLPPSEWTMTAQKQAVQRVESYLGRRLDISNHYYWFEKPLSDWREAWDLQQGRIPMISWDGTSTSKILSGRVDPIISRMADRVSNLHGNVFLRFFWEMDGHKKANVVEGPGRFIAAWRYVHNLFQQRGTDNVAWVWCPNAWAFQDHGRAMRYYPGDAYVDWACADGYNWGHNQWRGFGSIFQAYYRTMAGRKPMMVGETASVEQGGNKANWIARTAAQLRATYPRIRALVWFDSVDGGYDWRINTTAKTYRAYRNMARMAWFNP